MSRYTPAARVWVITIVLVGLAISLVSLEGAQGAGASSTALIVFALCAAIAHAYPIKSAFDGATYQLTNIFLVAGAIILPPGLLLLLPLAAITPNLWQQRKRPGAVVRWAFNVSQTVLAMQITHLGVVELRLAPFAQSELLALLGGAILFTVSQALIVGMAIACQSKVPLARADTLAGPALLSDGLLNIIGALVAALWLQAPTLLVLIAPLFLIAHRLTRGAQLSQLAQVDPKTGLHNVRYFEQALEEAFLRALGELRRASKRSEADADEAVRRQMLRESEGELRLHLLPGKDSLEAGVFFSEFLAHNSEFSARGPG